MSAGGAVLKVKAHDSAWETLGAEDGRLAGIVPELDSIEATADPWGPLDLSFTIKSGTGSSRPDLYPYTAIDYEQDGVLVWSGRLRSREGGESQFAVRGRGWQFHLDDDLYDRVYVHTRLSDYQDIRQHNSAQLGAAEYNAAGQVSVGDLGGVQLAWPKDTIVSLNARVGVLLDLGPNSVGKRVVLQWESSNNKADATLYCRGLDAGPFGSGDSGFHDAFTIINNSAASGTTAGSFTATHRYVCFFMFCSTGFTAIADIWFRLKSIQVFRDAAYESANASILKADTIVKDARNAKAPLLSQADDLITAGTFSIPEYFTSGYLSPRQVMEAINAYENYRLKIGGPGLNQIVFDAKPSVPLFEVGEASGATFADSSIDGDEIYDTAIIDGTGPDGARLVSTRTQVGTLLEKVAGLHRSRTLPISTALTQAVADRFGDLWLTEHKTAPFAGTLTAHEGITRVQGGAAVPAHELLLFAGEKIRFNNMLDPDTGGWARDGRIAGVSYRPGRREAVVAIDDRRDNFERILARYGILAR